MKKLLIILVSCVSIQAKQAIFVNLEICLQKEQPSTASLIGVLNAAAYMVLDSTSAYLDQGGLQNFLRKVSQEAKFSSLSDLGSTDIVSAYYRGAITSEQALSVCYGYLDRMNKHNFFGSEREYQLVRMHIRQLFDAPFFAERTSLKPEALKVVKRIVEQKAADGAKKYTVIGYLCCPKEALICLQKKYSQEFSLFDVVEAVPSVDNRLTADHFSRLSARVGVPIGDCYCIEDSRAANQKVAKAAGMREYIISKGPEVLKEFLIKSGMIDRYTDLVPQKTIIIDINTVLLYNHNYKLFAWMIGLFNKFLEELPVPEEVQKRMSWQMEKNRPPFLNAYLCGLISSEAALSQARELLKKKQAEEGFPYESIKKMIEETFNPKAFIIEHRVLTQVYELFNHLAGIRRKDGAERYKIIFVTDWSKEFIDQFYDNLFHITGIHRYQLMKSLYKNIQSGFKFTPDGIAEFLSAQKIDPKHCLFMSALADKCLNAERAGIDDIIVYRTLGQMKDLLEDRKMIVAGWGSLPTNFTSFLSDYFAV